MLHYLEEYYEGTFLDVLFLWLNILFNLELNQKMVEDYYVKNLKRLVLIYQLEDVKRQQWLY